MLAGRAAASSVAAVECWVACGNARRGWEIKHSRPHRRVSLQLAADLSALIPAMESWKRRRHLAAVSEHARDDTDTLDDSDGLPMAHRSPYYRCASSQAAAQSGATLQRQRWVPAVAAGNTPVYSCFKV